MIYVYARDANPVREFWARAGDAGRPASTGLLDMLAIIQHRLIERGWLAPDPFAELTPTWAWSSPAPPGRNVARHVAAIGEGSGTFAEIRERLTNQY